MIRATCAALLLVAVVGATDADAENATTDRVDHIIDVHTRSGEVRIAAVTTIGDGPLSQPRDTWLRSWFAWLDGNGDRELRGDELQHIPRPGSLRAIWRGDFDNFSAEFASDEELRAGTGLNDSLTEEMLVRYYNRADLFLPQLRAGDRETWDDRSTRWLFEALGNADHAITAISLATAPQKLAATDVDADERWSSAELKRALDTGARVAPDRAAASARFNVHGDELRAEATSVTRLATSIRLDTATEQPPMALAGAIMHLQSRRGMGTQAYEFGRDSLLQQFDGDDVNRDGALDDAEIQQSSLSAAFTSLHKLIARKPTKLLRLDDLEQLLSLHQQAASLLVVVTAQDRGRSLFSTLDANDDRLLTLRELAEGWSRLKAYDADNNAQVTWEELPNEYSVAWSLGPPAPLVASGTVSADVEEAPRWFAKMDRNGDGDISPREFLGRSADFERLDVNGDRLISPAEAAAAAAD